MDSCVTERDVRTTHLFLAWGTHERLATPFTEGEERGDRQHPRARTQSRRSRPDLRAGPSVDRAPIHPRGTLSGSRLRDTQRSTKLDSNIKGGVREPRRRRLQKKLHGKHPGELRMSIPAVGLFLISHSEMKYLQLKCHDVRELLKIFQTKTKNQP